MAEIGVNTNMNLNTAIVRRLRRLTQIIKLINSKNLCNLRNLWIIFPVS